MDMTKLIFALGNFANVPKTWSDWLLLHGSSGFLSRLFGIAEFNGCVVWCYKRSRMTGAAVNQETFWIIY
jgi:hypothetical protein